MWVAIITEGWQDVRSNPYQTLTTRRRTHALRRNIVVTGSNVFIVAVSHYLTLTLIPNPNPISNPNPIPNYNPKP